VKRGAQIRVSFFSFVFAFDIERIVITLIFNGIYAFDENFIIVRVEPFFKQIAIVIDSEFIIFFEHSIQQIFNFSAANDFFLFVIDNIEVDFFVQNFPADFFVVFSLERKLTKNHSIQNQPQTPNIQLRVRLEIPVQNFGRDEPKRSRFDFVEVFSVFVSADSKVDQNDVFSLFVFEQNVVRF
jgi:hypothetical protein